MYFCSFIDHPRNHTEVLKYTRHILSNGLTLIVNENHDTPLTTVNILYNVGSRNENPDRTGFAHLFEHLMFGGSDHYPDYDAVVNQMGGENNAYTNTDITNYYLTIPSECLDQALALEADRLQYLTLSQKSLEVQQKVVTEEYHQRYINKPYGDAMLLLMPLSYDRHPYRWCTIGRDIRHVKESTLEDVQAFHSRFYRPGNAIMAISGSVDTAEAITLAEKHFGAIPDTAGREGFDMSEPEHLQPRRLEVERDVPATAIYKTYLMSDRHSKNFFVCDLLSDILSNGNSSRMYNSLVKEKQLLSEISAVITGTEGPGLFLIKGRLNPGVETAEAEEAIEQELAQLRSRQVSEYELQKVKNKFENTFVYSQYKSADCAANLCYYEWLGHLDWVNTEPEMYAPITSEDLIDTAATLLDPSRGRTLVITPKTIVK